MKSELHESQELCCRHTLELRIRQPRWSQKGDGNSCGASGCLRLLSFWPNSAAADCVFFSEFIALRFWRCYKHSSAKHGKLYKMLP